MDNYRRDAKFDTVRFDEDAVAFHAMKFELGFRYPLSVACYQMTQIIKMKEAQLREDTTKP